MLDRGPLGVAAHAATSPPTPASHVREAAVQPAVAGQLGMERRHQHRALAAATGVALVLGEHLDAVADPLDPRRADEHARDRLGIAGEVERRPRSSPPDGRRRCGARRCRSGPGSAGRGGRPRPRGPARSSPRRCRTAGRPPRAGPDRRLQAVGLDQLRHRGRLAAGDDEAVEPSSSCGRRTSTASSADVGTAPARARGTRPAGRGRRPYQPRVCSSPLSPSSSISMPTIGSPRPDETSASELRVVEVGRRLDDRGGASRPGRSS